MPLFSKSTIFKKLVMSVAEGNLYLEDPYEREHLSNCPRD
jgi:hypothetical protein